MNREQWQMKRDALESRSPRSVDATSGNVKIQIRKEKKVIASNAQTLSEAEGKAHVKATTYATTLHIRPRVEVIEGAAPSSTTVVTKK